VVLAIGLGEQPCWPPWAQAGRLSGARVDHVFDPGFTRAAVLPSERVAVVGGGISAAQLALSLAERAPGKVVLVSRHGARVHQFDSDPGWLGPKQMQAFERTADHGARRAMIAAARHRGSMPPEIAARLAKSIATGALVRREFEVEALHPRADGAAALAVRDGDEIVADRIVLATGFEPARPGGAWLTAAIEDLGLPCAACGYPIVGPSLAWRRDLFVTGPLAELELGPTARNIAGARRAGERIACAARPDRRAAPVAAAHLVGARAAAR
jgi:cation diffusion facilitator CzcD-associated flavoprotein CzcO